MKQTIVSCRVYFRADLGVKITPQFLRVTPQFSDMLEISRVWENSPYLEYC